MRVIIEKHTSEMVGEKNFSRSVTIDLYYPT